MKPLRRLLLTNAAEWSVLFQALPLLILVRLSLWIVPFGRIRRAASSLLPRIARAQREGSLPPERITWLVTVVSRLVPLAHCLTRAIVAQLLLARSGYRADLRIGVRKDGNKLDAHAWLMLDGRPLFEDAERLSNYSPFGTSFTSSRDYGNPT